MGTMNRTRERGTEMKRIDLRYKLLAVTVLALTVWGAAVNLPFAFQAGDVISADEMNQTLQALNDGKQERVTGTCPAGSSIREIEANGGVVCETDDGAGGGNEHEHLGQAWSGDVGIGLSVETVAAGGLGVLARAPSRAMVGVLGGGSCPGTYAVGGCGGVEVGVRAISDTRAVVGTIGALACDGAFAVGGCGGAAVGVRAVSSTGIGLWATSDARAVVGTLGATSCAGTYAVGGCAPAGIGVLGVSTSGSAAVFTGGSGGGGSCSFSGGAGWSCTSDANLKENFAPVDGAWVLDRLVGMPVATWSMRGDADATPHVGPTAQDFQAAFGFGDDDTTINSVDAQGVALAAIQGLYSLVAEQRAQIAALEAEMATLRER